MVGCVNPVYNFQALHSFFCGLPAAIAAVLADPPWPVRHRPRRSRGSRATTPGRRWGDRWPRGAARFGSGARSSRRGATPRPGRRGRPCGGFRPGPVFDAADLEGIATDPLPALWRPLPDDCAPASWRVSRAIRDTGLAIFERPLPPGRQGTATADAIVVSASIPDSRNRLATLLHEYAHCLPHFGPVARDKDEHQCELEA